MAVADERKVLVEIFVPSNVCACSVERWVGMVWRILDKFPDQLQVTTFDTQSTEAKAKRINTGTVLVAGKKTDLSALIEVLQTLTKQR